MCNCKGGMCGKGGWCGCTASIIGKVLVIVGGINWGLVGAGMLAGGDMMSWNLVNMILGSWPMLEAVVYVLVGLAAVMSIWGCRCKKCMGGSCGAGDKCLCGGNCVNGKCDKCGGICGDVHSMEGQNKA